MKRARATLEFLCFVALSCAIGDLACRPPHRETLATPPPVVVEARCMDALPALDPPSLPSAVDADGTVHVPAKEMARLYVYLHTLRVYLEDELARCGPAPADAGPR